MAPQEVAGLHALARAHGGSLTINPDTGLPEAGFLSKLLPTLIGAGLSIASGGTLTPLMAAGITGAGYGVATGSLSKGLMAGLGAFGGAGLAGGLTAAGAAGASSGLSALDAGMGVMPTGTIGAAEVLAPTALDAGMGAMPTGNIGASALDAGMGAYPGATVAAPAVSPIQAQQAVMRAAPQTVTPMADRFAQAGRGFTNLGTEAGREAFMGKAGVDGGMGLLKYGYAAGLPMLMQDPKQLEEKEKIKAYEYSYDPGRVADPQAGYTGAYTGERTYFNPRFVRTAAGGGLMDIGPVEAMSRANQSQMQPAYAQGGVSDMAVGPYTGAETFAEGGETKAVRPVEQDPYYTMSGQSGDAFKYLMGQMPIASKAPAAAPVAAAPSTSATGFLKGISGIAGPDGVYNVDTGTTTPWSESNPKPAFNGGMFGGSTQTGAVPPAQTAAEANTTMRPYTFDPMTGTFTAMPIIQPTVTGYNPSGFSYESFGGMDGGMGGGLGGGTEGGMGGMSNSGEGGGGPGEGGWARGGIASLAQGGQSHLGDYSDGGRMLRGPGDGVSDSIPATIGGKRPARLADGEFVVPARIVSELGNGSSEAGARKLYAMMDRVQKARGKTTGKNRVAVNSRAEKLLPA
jgi:hypothetical protein